MQVTFKQVAIALLCFLGAIHAKPYLVYLALLFFGRNITELSGLLAQQLVASILQNGKLHRLVISQLGIISIAIQLLIHNGKQLFAFSALFFFGSSSLGRNGSILIRLQLVILCFQFAVLLVGSLQFFGLRFGLVAHGAV